MTNKIGIPPTARDFYFTTAGDNTWSGLSFETAVKDPNQAITLVNALIPAPDSSNPASINGAQTGTYDSGVTIPDWTTCNGEFASIVTTDAVAVTCGSNQGVAWAAIVALATSGTGVDITAQSRVNFRLQGGVGGGALAANGSFFSISGACNDIFTDAKEVELSGDGWTMYDITATSPTPIDNNADIVKFIGNDTRLVDYNPVNATDKATLNISTSRDDPAAAPTGTEGYRIRNGTFYATGLILDHATPVHVENGGTLVLNYAEAIGDIVVDVGGTLKCNIISHPSGNIVPLGTINGVINGNTYGTYVEGTEHFVTWFRPRTIPGSFDTFGTITLDAALYKLDAVDASFIKTTGGSRTVVFQLVNADTADIYYTGTIATTAQGTISVNLSVSVAFPVSGTIRMNMQVRRSVGIPFGIFDAGAKLQFSDR